MFFSVFLWTKTKSELIKMQKERGQYSATFTEKGIKYKAKKRG